MVRSYHKGHEECAGERGTSISEKFSVDRPCRLGLTAGEGLTVLGSLVSRWIMSHQSDRYQGQC